MVQTLLQLESDLKHARWQAFGLTVLYLVLAAQTLAELAPLDRVRATLVLEALCAPAAFVQSFGAFRSAGMRAAARKIISSAVMH